MSPMSFASGYLEEISFCAFLSISHSQRDLKPARSKESVKPQIREKKPPNVTFWLLSLAIRVAMPEISVSADFITVVALVTWVVRALMSSSAVAILWVFLWFFGFDCGFQ